MQPGSRVGVTVKRGRLLVELQQRPRYSLDDLLAQCHPCHPKARRDQRDREWIDSKPVGRELI